MFWRVMLRKMFPPAFVATAILGGTSLLVGGGCVGFTAQILYMIKGRKVEAECESLEGKKVAVVCVSESSYGPGTPAGAAARAVEQILAREVRDIEIIDQDQIADWVDRNDWNEIDYRQVGKGVGAEMVVAIDLNSYTLREGQTLYRGRADVTVSVLDMAEKGKTTFRRNLPDVAYPISTGVHTTDMTYNQFEKQFVAHLANQVSNLFYAHDFYDTIAADRPAMGR